MPLQFRPALPFDVETAIPLIYSSGPAAFDFVFKRHRSAQEFLRTAFLNGAGEFGYRNHSVVERNGKVVGIGAGFSGETGLAFTLAAAQQIIAFYGLASVNVIQCGLQIEQVIEPPAKGVQYLAHLGVVPEVQSQGIGAQLIQYLLAQGQAAGRTRAELDVAVTNPRAQALYVKLGFVEKHEKPSRLANAYGTVVNHLRMERILN